MKSIVPAQQPAYLGGTAVKLCGIGALTPPHVPRSRHHCFPCHFQILPTVKTLLRNEATSHSANWRVTTSQCLEWPMAKVTDPQMAHLVRNQSLALVLGLIV